MYLSAGYDASDRAAVEGGGTRGDAHPARRADRPVPNGHRASASPTAESVSAVDFLVRTHGQDALVALIRSYADGRTDDEAFKAALGMDMAAFGTRGWPTWGRCEPPSTGRSRRRPVRCRRRGRAAAPVSRQRAGRLAGRHARTAAETVRPRAAVPACRRSGWWRRRRPVSAAASAIRRCARRTRPVAPSDRRCRPACGPSRPGRSRSASPCSGSASSIAAQLAAEGPRVRYTTQERSPLVETATELQTEQDELKARILDLRAQIQVAERPGEGSAALVRELNDQLQQARIAAGPDPADRDRDRPPARGLPGASPARRDRGRLPRRRARHPRRRRGAVGRRRRGHRGQRRADHADHGDHRHRPVDPRQLGLPRAAVPGHGARARRPVRPAQRLARLRRLRPRPGARATASGSRSPSPRSVDMPAFAGTVTLRYSRPEPSPARRRRPGG